MTYQRRPESDEERAARLRRESLELAQARRNAAAGELISGPELEAWLKSLDQDVALSVPKPAHGTE